MNTEKHPELARKMQEITNNKALAPKAIKQHETNVTANFVADKMKRAGDKMIGKTYTIEQAHKTFLNKSGLQARNSRRIKTLIAGPKGVLEQGLAKEAEKSTYWTHQWRAALLEQRYTENLEQELKKAPKQGFILLRPKNPLSVGGHRRALAKWYDPVLKKTYDEVDWVSNADSFIPELKTTVEVKTKSSTTASSQNKGINTENFQKYDGTVAYATLEVTDIKSYPRLGWNESRAKAIAYNLAEVLDIYGNQSNSTKRKNAKEWENFINHYGNKLVYETKVDAYFSTFYSIEKVARHVRGMLQNLGLEAGKPLPKEYLESVGKPRISPANIAASYLEFAVMDKDFDGILRIGKLREAVPRFRADANYFAKRPDIDTAEQIIEAILTKYLEDDEWVRLFREVARNTGKLFASPSVRMTQRYVSDEALDPSTITLGGSTLT